MSNFGPGPFPKIAGKSPEKSGNFIFSRGNFDKMKKVREFQNFPKKLQVNRLFIFHKLQTDYLQKHPFSDIYC